MAIIDPLFQRILTDLGFAFTLQQDVQSQLELPLPDKPCSQCEEMSLSLLCESCRSSVDP